MEPSQRGNEEGVEAIRWRGGKLLLLDQRRLPGQEIHLECGDVEAVARAIADMVVRGAPAIGITAAYGAVLAVRQRYAEDPANWLQNVESDLRLLGDSRPTAVNLFWAIERIRSLLRGCGEVDPQPLVESEACLIHAEDIAANRRMGELGAQLIEPGKAVLTHCNTGALATGGFGTALGVIRAAWSDGRIERVFAGETRPWMQGARLTAWELVRERIPVTLLCDGAAASLMGSGAVSWVIVGADRIAANGDVANKVGTYSLAVLARQHGVRFMVVAPTSTCDPGTADGDAIVIEQRSPDEVLSLAGQRLAPPGADAWNPAFDVTPARLVDALVTEAGVVRNPDREAMGRLLAR